jgi:hypothetical protein
VYFPAGTIDVNVNLNFIFFFVDVVLCGAVPLPEGTCK